MRQQAIKNATIPTRASIEKNVPRGVKLIVSCGAILFPIFWKTGAKVHTLSDINIANSTKFLQLGEWNIANSPKRARNFAMFADYETVREIPLGVSARGKNYEKWVNESLNGAKIRFFAPN